MTESGKLDIDGFNIYYEKAGTGDHVVLLLPGALGLSTFIMFYVSQVSVKVCHFS